jgi:hypothetical protein
MSASRTPSVPTPSANTMAGNSECWNCPMPMACGRSPGTSSNTRWTISIIISNNFKSQSSATADTSILPEPPTTPGESSPTSPKKRAARASSKANRWPARKSNWLIFSNRPASIWSRPIWANSSSRSATTSPATWLPPSSTRTGRRSRASSANISKLPTMKTRPLSRPRHGRFCGTNFAPPILASPAETFSSPKPDRSASSKTRAMPGNR